MGFVTFRIVNRGNEGHGATIVRLEGGRTLTPGDSSATTNYLEPGNCALVCFVPGASGILHLLEHNQAHAFVVRPGDERDDSAHPGRVIPA